ncbi:MAG: hypothetical protein JJU21_04840 [Salinarimonas sp.]|nr:hypothetical protein [Salinarimonas sp.]
MFQRIQHFFNPLSTNWTEDPGARGVAKMAAFVEVKTPGSGSQYVERAISPARERNNARNSAVFRPAPFV